jgi:hypothetical protein
MWLLGFFQKPFRIIYSSIGMILLFGLLYFGIGYLDGKFPELATTNDLSCIKSIAYQLSKSIYFSGITFYTIGYSDLMENISNQNLVVLKELLALLEGFLGVIFTSSIIISLLNRYRIQD